MKTYLVETKNKKYLVQADNFGVFDITDGRRSIYKFFKSTKDGVVVPAIFDSREVKAITEV